MNHSCYVVPIETCRTKESPSVVMVESMASLDITRDVGSQWLSLWSNPINNCGLHPLSVISPSTIGTLLDLLIIHLKSVLNIYKWFIIHTKSTITITSSSEDNMSRSSIPGIDWRSSWKTACSFLSLSLSHKGLSKDQCNRYIHSHQTLIVQSIITHGLQAIQEERLYIAEGMDSPAKVASMVHQWVLRSPGAESGHCWGISNLNKTMHGFFLGPDCNAPEIVHFLEADVADSFSVPEVDIGSKLWASDDVKTWLGDEKQSSLLQPLKQWIIDSHLQKLT